jgi:hypothetical protein
MKKTFVKLSFASLLLLCTATIVVAQKGSLSRALNSIEIGQRLDDAKAVLRDHGGYGEDDLALSIPDKDIHFLSCTLDKKQAFAAIYYSKSRQTITGMSIEFHPIGSPQKAHRASMKATSIRFEDDGSYVIHFSAPVPK